MKRRLRALSRTAIRRSARSTACAPPACPATPITIISGEPIEDHEFCHSDKSTWMWYIASAGGVVGLVVRDLADDA